MRSVMFKSTLREIKGSLGRWAAILAIVALGVGFFSGLKACRTAFLETGNKYLSEHGFFDYQLMSTLGLEDEDVSIISDTDGVDVAEGSYSADVLIYDEDDDSQEITTRFLTISDQINTPSLVAGTMPSKGSECLGDPQYFTEDDIGKTIYISSSNTDDTLDMLAYDSYTITGIADSPLYLNFERGSSSIGDGSVACFVMIPAEGFSSDVYTEIYVRLEDSVFIFSDEYDQIVQDAEDPLTEALDTASERRYDSIVDDARQEVADAEAELSQHQQDIAQAQSEIASGQQELDENQARIDEGRAALQDGLTQYEEGLSQYEANLAAFEEQRDDAYAQLKAYHDSGFLTDEQYAAQKAALDQQFASAQAQLDEAKAQLDDSLAQLNSTEAQLDSGQEEIDRGRAQLENARAELAEGQAQLDDAQAQLDDAEKQIDDIEHPTNYVLTRQANVGYVCFDSDTSIVEGISKIFPIFFFLVAALVCMTTMSRMIEEQRTQIGVLKALGYSSGQILKKYVFYSGSSAIIGGVAGFFAGTYVFTTVIWEVYKMMYEFADVIIVFDWLTGALALAVAILCSVGTTLYSCHQELGEAPAQLIRPKAPSAGKRIFLERIPAFWNRLKFLQKVSIRNVFRYKKRFFMMIVGICGCTALLVAGFGIRDSIKNVVSMQYDEIFHVDYEVTFNHDMSQADQETFLEDNSAYIEDCLFLYTGSVDARMDGQIKSVNLVVCGNDDPISNFIDLHNDDGQLDYPKAGEGIINSNLAQVLGIEVGDDFTVYDSEMNPLTVRIAGLCDNYVYNYLYINDETYADAWGDPQINAAYIIGTDTGEGQAASTPQEAGSLIAESNGVSSVSVTEDFKTRINNTMQSLDYVVALIIVSAAALAFIVLYNLTNINITERIREIATIKVLGFYPRETSSYVFRENLVLTAIAAIVGIPLGTLLHRFVMDRIQVDLMSFDVHITVLSYILSVAGTFVFAMIVNMTMRHKIDKISMTESLKSVE